MTDAKLAERIRASIMPGVLPGSQAQQIVEIKSLHDNIGRILKRSTFNRIVKAIEPFTRVRQSTLDMAKMLMTRELGQWVNFLWALMEGSRGRHTIKRKDAVLVLKRQNLPVQEPVGRIFLPKTNIIRAIKDVMELDPIGMHVRIAREAAGLLAFGLENWVILLIEGGILTEQATKTVPRGAEQLALNRYRLDPANKTLQPSHIYSADVLSERETGEYVKQLQTQNFPSLIEPDVDLEDFMLERKKGREPLSPGTKAAIKSTIANRKRLRRDRLVQAKSDVTRTPVYNEQGGIERLPKRPARVRQSLQGAVPPASVTVARGDMPDFDSKEFKYWFHEKAFDAIRRVEEKAESKEQIQRDSASVTKAVKKMWHGPWNPIRLSQSELITFFKDPNRRELKKAWFDRILKAWAYEQARFSYVR